MPTTLAETKTRGSETPLLRAHMPELDSVRGLAILMVMLYHGFYWTVDLRRFAPVERAALTAAWTGRLGVNLFFVLSGFLITGLLLESKGRKNYYGRFYWRRALRILPAYYATLALLAALGTSWAFLGLSFLYLANLTPLFGVLIAYPVLWSLAVEEHFYFVWPVVVKKLTTRGVLAASGAIVVLSPLVRLWTFYVIGRDSSWVSYKVFDYTWNAADGLACGAMVAAWLREFEPERKRVAQVAGALAAAAVTLLAGGIPLGILNRHQPMGAALQVVPWQLLFTAALLGALLAGSAGKEWARSRWLEFFGRISYGLYLYHLLVFEGYDWLAERTGESGANAPTFGELAIRFLVAGGLAVGIAYLSREYFEERFLRLKGRFG